jgi:hypothetical protein
MAVISLADRGHLVAERRRFRRLMEFVTIRVERSPAARSTRVG